MRILILVAYDGTAYHGWQLQKNGITIESELNRAASELFKDDIQVTGASRTDAGVHALCNIAVFDAETKMPAEKIAYALNQRLPDDIKVQKSMEVQPDFHPRKCESKKTYEYLLYLGEFPLPTKRLYSHHVYSKLDLDEMKKAAEYFVGEHDFKSFCSVETTALTTVREVVSLDIINYEDGCVGIRVCGKGFLYNMVRIIAGTLLEVGKGKIPPESIPDIIEKKDRTAAGPTLPANGLTLVAYEYTGGNLIW